MVGRGAGERPGISEQMVYQRFTAQPRDFSGNRQKSQCGCERFVVVNERTLMYYGHIE